MRRMRGKGQTAVPSQKLMLNGHKVTFRSIYLVFFLRKEGGTSSTRMAVQMAKHIGPEAGTIQLAPGLR